MKRSELFSMLSALAQTQPDGQPDQELTSPMVKFQPGRNEINRAVQILQKMDPNYFKGVREIVITPGAYYGFVESGPDKDPSVINVNADRIVQESGAETGPDAAIATAVVIAHERGHVGSFDQQQGFVGGESPAEQEENRVRTWIQNNMAMLQPILSQASFDRKDLLKMASIFLRASKNDYMRDYMRNRYHSKRKELIDLLGGKCVRCGSKKNLHVDHIDKKKKTFRAADVHSVADSMVKKELNNLQLLCNKCHDEKTRESWDYATPKPRHGTLWMYSKHKCRCPKCQKAYDDYKAQKREQYAEMMGKAPG